MKRMILRKLTLSGDGKKDAVLLFEEGLNIVTGDSDTGKTYAFQCLNYMLGGNSLPKEITESDGYTHFSLQFTVDDEIYQLDRELGDSRITMVHNAESTTMSCKHDATSTNNLSRVLLKLLSEDDKLIQLKTSNKSGAKRTLSFRDLVHLCLISETDILAEQSSFQANNYTEKTGRKSALRYVITGEDDSQELSHTIDADEKMKRAGVVQFLEKKQHELECKISEIETDNGFQLYINAESTNKILKKIEMLRKELSDKNATISSQQESIREQSSICATDEARIIEFNNLLEHYEGEFSKVEALSVYTDFLTQLPRLACPVCGQRIAEELLRDGEEETLFSYYQQNSSQLQTKIADIKRAIADIEHRLNVNKSSIKTISKEKREVEDQVAVLQKRLNGYGRNIALQRHMDALKRTLEIYRQELDSVKADIISYSERAQNSFSLPDISTTHVYSYYCQLVRGILESWGFKKESEVYFDENELDLVIDGKNRNAWGKGYRAFIMAAMTVGLMRYCYENNKLHPGFVILDSPLVSLKERKHGDSGELIEDYMERRMIENIAQDERPQKILCNRHSSTV